MASLPDGVEGFSVEVGPVRLAFSRMAVAHSLIWSISELHTLARDDGGGRSRPPLATGPWAAGVVAGLFAQSSALTRLRELGVEIGALMEMDVTYRGPVYGDDVIHARCSIRSGASTADGDTIVVADECFGADGRHVFTSARRYRWTATPGATR